VNSFTAPRYSGLCLLIDEAESYSLFTRAPRLFTTLQAIVLDEIHLFDNGPRGDHIHCRLPHFEQLYRQATLTTPPSHLRDALRLLM
jgi:hypothetical protein